MVKMPCKLLQNQQILKQILFWEFRMTGSEIPEIVTLKTDRCFFIAESDTISKRRGFAEVKPHP